VQRLHVAGVRSLAVHRLREDVDRPTGDLGQRGVLDVRQPGDVREEEVPQPACPGLGLQALHHRRHRVFVRPGRGPVRVVLLLGREHPGDEEVLQAVGERLRLR